MQFTSIFVMVRLLGNAHSIPLPPPSRTVSLTGQRIDGPEGRSEPEMWSLHARPDHLFVDNEKQLEVPHTASVTVCHECGGMGRKQCWKCKGSGRVACAPCDGSGQVPQSPQPGGKGAESTVDKMVGRVTCQLCGGSGIER